MFAELDHQREFIALNILSKIRVQNYWKIDLMEIFIEWINDQIQNYLPKHPFLTC